MTDTRLAILPLTGAGERECRDCVYLDRSHCDALDASLPVSAVPWRLPECIQAERDAARLRAVEGAARAYVEADDVFNSETLATEADMAAAQARVMATWAALRAALKETP